jgi:branched-chain amino acid transport system ATP-binding protein
MSAPRLLAIDEPSLGLAPKLVDAMLKTIAELKAGGTTILLVEQSLSLVEGVVDRVYRLEEGMLTGGGAAPRTSGKRAAAETHPHPRGP